VPHVQEEKLFDASLPTEEPGVRAFGGLDPRIEPNPDRNEVRRNVILQNGRSPDSVRALSPGVDIAYDGTGVGTCFIDNIFRTEFPTHITSIFCCP